MVTRTVLAWATFWVVAFAGGLIAGLVTMNWAIGLGVFAAGVVLVVVQVVLIARKGVKSIKKFVNEPLGSPFSDSGWPNL